MRRTIKRIWHRAETTDWDSRRSWRGSVRSCDWCCRCLRCSGRKIDVVRKVVRWRLDLLIGIILGDIFLHRAFGTCKLVGLVVDLDGNDVIVIKDVHALARTEATSIQVESDVVGFTIELLDDLEDLLG